MALHIEKSLSEANGGSRTVTYKVSNPNPWDGLDTIMKCEKGKTFHVTGPRLGRKYSAHPHRRYRPQE